MKHYSPDLPKKKNSSSNLIYYLLLGACVLGLIGTGTWWYLDKYRWIPSWKPSAENIKKVEESLVSTNTSEGVRQTLAHINQNDIDLMIIDLEDNSNPNLTNAQKKKVRQRLEKLKNESDPLKQKATLLQAEWTVYPREKWGQFGKWGKQIDEKQNFWESFKFAEEEQEIQTKLNKLMLDFFDEFMKNHLTPKEREQKLNLSLVRPLKVDNEETNASNFAAHLARVKEHPETQKAKMDFLGYAGIIKEGSGEKSEGGLTLGVTVSKGWEEGGMDLTTRDESGKVLGVKKTRFLVAKPDFHIKLKKEVYFGRYGFHKWSYIKKDDKGEDAVFTEPIDWWEFEDTVAHELAHVVIGFLWENYENESTPGVKSQGFHKGGHGLEHDDFTVRIKENVMQNSKKWTDFKDWWYNVEKF